MVPKFDFKTVDGAIEGLKNPNLATRYLAWTALHEMGAKAEPKLNELFEGSSDPRLRARALWLLGKIDGRGEHFVERALSDSDENIRIVGLRLARQLKLDLPAVVAKVV